jgi:hypothetical protein
MLMPFNTSPFNLFLRHGEKETAAQRPKYFTATNQKKHFLQDSERLNS